MYLPEDQPWVGAFLRSTAVFPAGRHDDDVDALSQFLGWRRTRNLRYGVLELGADYKSGKRKLPPSPEEFGERLPAAIVRVDNYAVQKKAGPKPRCPKPDCGSTATVENGGRAEYICNQCGTQFRSTGEIILMPGGARCACEKPLLVYAGGRLHCNSCSWDEPSDPPVPVNGVSRRDYDRGVGRLRGQFALSVDFLNLFGRFS